MSPRFVVRFGLSIFFCAGLAPAVGTLGSGDNAGFFESVARALGIVRVPEVRHAPTDSVNVDGRSPDVRGSEVRSRTGRRPTPNPSPRRPAPSVTVASKPSRSAPSAVTSTASHEIPSRWRGRTFGFRRLPIKAKLIALTFDDGPHSTQTPEVLRILRQYKAKATFFIIGNQIPGRGNVLRQIVREGHVVANHSMTHAYKPTPEQILVEVDEAEAAIRAVAGVCAPIYRPPGGILTNGLVDYAKSKGYGVLLWTNVVNDAMGADAETIEKLALEAQRGSVVLFHDGGGNHQPTLDVLPKILKKFTDDGYQMVTITEMLAVYEREINEAQQAAARRSNRTQSQSQSRRTGNRIVRP